MLEKKLIEAFRKTEPDFRKLTLKNFRTEFKSLFEGKKFEQSIKETAELKLGEEKKAELEYNKKLENTDLKDFFKNVKSFTHYIEREPERKLKNNNTFEKFITREYKLTDVKDKKFNEKNIDYLLELTKEEKKYNITEKVVTTEEADLEGKGFIQNGKIYLTEPFGSQHHWRGEEYEGDHYYYHVLKKIKKLGNSEIKFVFKDDKSADEKSSKLPRAKQIHESNTISEPGTPIQIDLKSISYLSIELKQDTKKPDKGSTEEPAKGSTKEPDEFQFFQLKKDL